MASDLPTMMMTHGASLPRQPDMYKMISHHQNAEQKEIKGYSISTLMLN